MQEENLKQFIGTFLFFAVPIMAVIWELLQ